VLSVYAIDYLSESGLYKVSSYHQTGNRRQVTFCLLSNATHRHISVKHNINIDEVPLAFHILATQTLNKIRS
jgi:hypothetical protein